MDFAESEKPGHVRLEKKEKEKYKDRVLREGEKRRGDTLSQRRKQRSWSE